MIRKYLLALALSLCSSSVYAACTQGDATGTWDVYYVADDTESYSGDPQGAHDAFHCVYYVRSNSFLSNSSFCVVDSEGWGLRQVKTGLNRMRVDPNCRVRFNLDNVMAEDPIIRHAQMSRDKLVVFGVLNGRSITASFNAVKR